MLFFYFTLWIKLTQIIKYLNVVFKIIEQYKKNLDVNFWLLIWQWTLS